MPVLQFYHINLFQTLHDWNGLFCCGHAENVQQPLEFILPAMAEHRPLQALLIKQKSFFTLEKLQMQIKAPQHTPMMVQNQTVCIFNQSQEG